MAAAAGQPVTGLQTRKDKPDALQFFPVLFARVGGVPINAPRPETLTAAHRRALTAAYRETCRKYPQFLAEQSAEN